MSSILRIATLNAHQFHGPTPKENYTFLRQAWMLLTQFGYVEEYRRRIRDWIINGDFGIVGLQEVFQRRGLPGKPERLKLFEGTGFETIIPHGLGSSFYRYEIVVLSKFPLLEGVSLKDVNHKLPYRLFWVADSGFTLAPLIFDGQLILVVNTHLHDSSVEKREDQAVIIIKKIKERILDWGEDLPIIILGDLNTVPKDARLNSFQNGDRNDYTNDATLDLFLNGLHLNLMATDTTQHYTYPAAVDEIHAVLENPANRTLDYILFSEHFECLSYRVRSDLFLSDHYPVEAELRLK